MEPVTAGELVERVKGLADPAVRGLDGGDLEAWLIDERLAERTDAGLVPTLRAVDIADGLDLAPVFSG